MSEKANSRVRELPFSYLLRGAVDSHVHCAPHINARTVTVFDAVRDAAAAGLAGLGIMDVFANTSGFAALAMRELGHLGVAARASYPCLVTTQGPWLNPSDDRRST